MYPEPMQCILIIYYNDSREQNNTIWNSVIPHLYSRPFILASFFFMEDFTQLLEYTLFCSINNRFHKMIIWLTLLLELYISFIMKLVLRDFMDFVTIYVTCTHTSSITYFEIVINSIT